MASTVLIGVIDDSLADSNISSTFMDNRIGGKPLFSPHLDISTLNIECQSCSVDCTFLLQIYCPIDQSPLDRVLYLFLCTNNACPKREIQCFRTLTKPVQSMEDQADSANGKKNSEKLFHDEWAEDDDWGVEVGTEPEMDFSAKFSSLDMDSEPSDSGKHFRELFCQRFISVFEEPEKNEKKSGNGEDVEKKDIIDLSKFMTEDSNGASAAEEYERSFTMAFGEDRTNYQFYKRVGRCSSQIIRYDWAGEPLAFNDNCLKKPVKNCDLCGSSRTFELQLMPALISILSQLKLDIFCVEFDAVYVFCCSNNCSRVSKHGVNSDFYREEAILYCEDYSKEQFCQFDG